MTTQTKVIQMALEALEEEKNCTWNDEAVKDKKVDDAIQACKDALAETQEPVGDYNTRTGEIYIFNHRLLQNEHGFSHLLLYTTPPSLDVRIKELEAKLILKEKVIEAIDVFGGYKKLEDEIAELTTKLDELVKFHSSADKLAEKQVECIAQLAELTAKLDKETVRADAWVKATRDLARELGTPDEDSNGSIQDWKRITAKVKQVKELEAKLDKAREALETEKERTDTWAMKYQALRDVFTIKPLSEELDK